MLIRCLAKPGQAGPVCGSRCFFFVIVDAFPGLSGKVPLPCFVCFKRWASSRVVSYDVRLLECIACGLNLAYSAAALRRCSFVFLLWFSGDPATKKLSDGLLAAVARRVMEMSTTDPTPGSSAKQDTSETKEGSQRQKSAEQATARSSSSGGAGGLPRPTTPPRIDTASPPRFVPPPGAHGGQRTGRFEGPLSSVFALPVSLLPEVAGTTGAYSTHVEPLPDAGKTC